MNKMLLVTLLVMFCTTGNAYERYDQERRYKKRSPPACVTREASVLSMMGWGIGLFAGIAILCSLIDSNPAPTPSTTPTNPTTP